jgi:hypothetical protein
VTVSLADIRATADGTYPVRVLEGCETALLLFAAGFHGRQDGIFVADAGLTATCVDIRPERLHDMAAVYPSAWEFLVDDAFDYVEQTERQWDVVSVDCPSGMFQRCADLIETWCDLARRVVVLGASAESARSVRRPLPWAMTSLVKRSDYRGGVYWAVMESG